MSETKKWEYGDQWVEVDLDLCSGSGECAEICPADVYEVVGDQVSADNISECVECGACEDVCPNDAILGHWAYG